jgi:hypothetical protein
MRASRIAFVVLAGAASTACKSVHWYPAYDDNEVTLPTTSAAREEAKRVAEMEWSKETAAKKTARATRLQIDSTVLRVALFPVNLVACSLSNFVAGVSVCAKFGTWGCLPIAPTFGLFMFGPLDAWHGYVFWQPTTADPETWHLGFQAPDS